MDQQGATLSSSAESKNTQWRAGDVVYGAALLVALFFLQRIEPLSDDPVTAQLFRLVLIVISLMCLALFSVYTCKKRQCWPLIQKMTLRSFLREFFISSWYMFLILLVCWLLLLIPAMILKPGMTHAQTMGGSGIEPNNVLMVVLLLIVITLGPVAEELFFRGFLYNALKSRFSLAVAAVVQAAVFSAFHQYDLFNSLRVFLFGIAFVVIYEKRKKLISAISAHVFVNAVATLPLLFVTAFDMHP